MTPAATTSPASREAPEGCINPAAARFPSLAGLLAYLDSCHGRVDLDQLASHLRDLSVTRRELEAVCIFGTKGYRRNVISRSESYELLALTWRSGHLTPIHDHKGSSCAFRVIEGTGTEIRFQKAPSGQICPVAAVPMPPGYVCAAEDSDIHQVANMQAQGHDLITLHIYSPPIQKMSTYEFACSTGPESDEARC